MNISGPFIFRPIATTLVWTAVVLAGALAHSLLPVAPLPQIEFPAISVTATMPGASPEVMASTVAMPLESSLGTIAGVTEMTSRNVVGSSRITLQFDLDRNVNDAAKDVQAGINAARAMMPSGLRQNPTYKKVNPSANPIMILALTSDSLPMGKLYDVATTIVMQKLSQIPGVGEVQVGGSSTPAVRINLDPDALTQYGISLDAVRAAVVSFNALTPKGLLENDTNRWQVLANDQLTSAEQYRPLIIAWRNNTPVRLSDVATVEDSVENIRNVGYFNEDRAILVIVRTQANANIIQTVDEIRRELPVLKAILPADVNVAVAMDRTPSIRTSVTEAQKTLIISIFLVMIVVLIFLRNWRAALIPTVAVPVSLIGTFGVMYLLHYSLNTMSLMGLIIATGFVVDDAIVVLENIIRHVERGESPFRAALRGTKEVGFTVLSMSISLIAVFIPILMMGGLPGRLFREFAVTLSVSILISMVVSLTLTPMMASRMLIAHKASKARPVTSRFDKWIARCDLMLSNVSVFYSHTLDWALRHGRTMMLLLLATICLNVYLYKVIPKGLFPQQDTGMMIGFFSTDAGTSFDAMSPKLDKFRKTVMADPAVQTVTAFASGSGGGNTSFLAVQLKPFAERKLSVQDVVNRLRPQLGSTPGARLFLIGAQDVRAGARQSSSSYQFTLMASELSDLKEWLPKVQQAIAKLPELVDVDTDVEDKGREIELIVNREAATRLGVSMAKISAQLNDAFSQRQISVIYRPLNQYRVVLGVSPEHAVGPESLENVYVINASGERVPLKAFAHFEDRNAPISVNHQGLFAADTISFDLAQGVTLGQATEAINRAIAEINLPTDKIQAGFQGTAQLLQKALSNQPLLILAAIITMYIVLGILYESTIHPLTILSTLPSAGVGALLALLVVRTEFSLIALIGVFLLIGIVKKNAIMMVDFALDSERRLSMPPKAAIHLACMTRFRPILMTTCAAIFGAFPLVFANGAGVELRQPLGITILGGLLVSQLLTLYTTPVVYLYLDRFSAWLKSRQWFARTEPHRSINLRP
jgi:multidrug efflux pump